MEPRIQYAKTSDGVNIAYWTLGSGPPLVHLFPLWSHVEEELSFRELRAWYERLASKWTVIRYDPRGTGLSDHTYPELSLDAATLDIEAVADDCGLTRFSLLAFQIAGPVAAAFAARSAQRTSHLVLLNSWASNINFYGTAQARALVSMRAEDWNTFTESVGSAFTGWSAGEAGSRMAQLGRRSVSREESERFAASVANWDATALLSQIEARTLVVCTRGFRTFDVTALSRSAVIGIRGARLAIVPGRSSIPSGDDLEATARAIDEFLGADNAAGPLPSGTAIILFLDIAESTALTTKLGDAAYRERERGLDASLRAAITEAGGTPVEGKVLGDGVMAVFTSARQAIDAAVRCRDLGNEAGLPLHLGIHAGDVVREGNNVHGGAVQVASRVQSVAAPGEILVSATVRDLGRTSANVQFEDRGEHDLRGVDEPQRLFAVRGGADG